MATKYFVGVRRNNHVIIFRAAEIPTTEKHPVNVRYCFGPYYSLPKATEVAMSQIARIDNEVVGRSMLWDGNADSEFI